MFSLLLHIMKCENVQSRGIYLTFDLLMNILQSIYLTNILITNDDIFQFFESKIYFFIELHN